MREYLRMLARAHEGANEENSEKQHVCVYVKSLTHEAVP